MGAMGGEQLHELKVSSEKRCWRAYGKLLTAGLDESCLGGGIGWDLSPFLESWLRGVSLTVTQWKHKI